MLFIREAAFHDADALARAHVESWEDTYGGGILPYGIMKDNVVEERVKYWKYTIQNIPEKTKLYVAELYGNGNPGVVGFGMCGPELVGLTDYDGEVQGLYLSRAGKGLGIGRKLMVKMAQYLVSQGFLRSCVWALYENKKAQSFYRYMGARDVACRYLTIGEDTIRECAFAWEDITALAENNIEAYR